MKNRIPKKPKRNTDAMNTVAFFPHAFTDFVTGQDSTEFEQPYVSCMVLPEVNPAFTIGENEDGDSFLQTDISTESSILHLIGRDGAYDAESVSFVGGRPPRDPKKPH